MGLLYENGQGVNKDHVKAFDLYSKEVALSDYAEAYAGLARLYEKGVGVDQSDILAFEAYKKAAMKGSFEAHKWIQSLATQGNADAQKIMGDLAQNPRNFRIGFWERVRNDHYQEAMNWYHLAADQGHIQAQRNLRETQRKLSEFCRKIQC